jgi:hemerythrin
MQAGLVRLGVHALDRDHERLEKLVEELAAVGENGGEHAQGVSLFEALVEESRAHFRREEAEMERMTYPMAAVHREEHAKLLEALQAIGAEYKADAIPLDGVLLSALSEWVNHHIRTSDAAFADYARSSQASAAARAVGEDGQ